ncbi:DUF3987 domain-containing protein [Roseimicrobium sp. ORNL1]|uniref:YfjI family protein n=1 Tax=Roseimicrobium sp. ORNL1 TaxID=2711231 RepID=UPI0013E14DBC|nr:DUF3987 domain-containing protein [Roseimicrobium sp. ORNL1]QIF02436.1 DUF3987 domain-containing protein [Roseimicrobium sp. ORNL1]
MPLNHKRLQKLRPRADKVIAQCPACNELGKDASGDHLVIFPDGRFACVVFSGSGVDAMEHRQRIFQLAGVGSNAAPAAPASVVRPQRVVPLSWQKDHLRLERNPSALERLAKWRAWEMNFCIMLARNGLIGLYEGRICFPVHGPTGEVIGRHVFAWPGEGPSRAWYKPGRNMPLLIGEQQLSGVSRVHVAESQWDALTLLFAGSWTGETLAEPFIVTRGAAVNPDIAELFGGVTEVTLWPQRDSPEHGIAASEKWVAGMTAIFPPSVRSVWRAELPSDQKDWNDVLRARGMEQTKTLAHIAKQSAVVVQRPVPLCQNLTNPTKLDGDMISAELSDFDNGEDTGIAAFPLDCLPGRIRYMVEAGAEHSLVPVELAASCALAVLSACLGSGLELTNGAGRRTRGNLFILPIAASGTGKGQAFEVMSRSFRNLEHAALETWTKETLPAVKAELALLEKEKKQALRRPCATKAEREELCADLKELEQRVEELQARLREPAWSTANATQAALENLLADSPNETIASMSPEARGVVDVVAGRYNSGRVGDESVYLSAFSGESVKVHRITRVPVLLKRPCLTVLWMIQPDAARRMLGDTNMTESGLLPRFLIVNTRAEPRHEPKVWPQMPDDVLSSWDALVKELVQAFRGSMATEVIRLSVEASEVFRAYRNRIVDSSKTGGALSDIGIYAARWAEQALRLAVNLHAAQHGRDASSHVLSVETARNAVELAEWFANQQVALLGATRHERRQERLERLRRALDSHPGKEATLRTLLRNHGIERKEVEALATEFPDCLVFEKRRTGDAGRPAEVVRLARGDASGPE